MRRSTSSPASSTRRSATHGPDSVAFYVSGQLLTEDYYVANKLMKGFIGSANIDTNSRLCMASSVAGHKRAFGSDTVPGCYEDLELADLVVLVGSNLAWCHPVLYQRIAAAKEKRPEMKVVLIDPRRTATADIADLHLPIKPDGDVPLFLGLLRYLARKLLDQARLHQAAHDRLQGSGACSRRARPLRPRASHGAARRDAGKILRAVCGNGEDRHRLQPGRQSIRLRHRQSQRHHQLPPGDRSYRQTGHGAVLRHRPTQRHGRARGRWSRQHARGAHEHRGRRTSRARAALLELTDDRNPARPQGGRHVPCCRRRSHQGAVDHGHQSRRLDAGGRERRGGDPRLPVRRRLRCDRRHRYSAAAPTFSCRQRPGARRTAR